MIFRYSLRARIIIAFCVFGAVLGIVYAVAVYISLDFIDDHLIDSRLNEEVGHFIAHHQRYSDYPGSRSPYITAYIGTKSMPLYVLDMIDGLAEGLHEAHFDEEEYHIAIQRLPGQRDLLYLLYEVSALEFTEKRKVSIRLVLVAGVALMVALGLWIGWLTSRKVIEPVVHLAEQVNRSGPENLPTDLSKNFFNDEVGVLARALEQAIQRVEAFVEREQQFSRDASHELRTPVTVIKGSVELLKKKLSRNEKSVNHPLERIERSVANMENIIETLLWLSREDVAVDQNQNFAVVPVVQETIEQNRYLIGKKPIDIEFVSEDEPQLSIPAALFQIALTNLIRNAAQHTASGTIRVVVMNDRIRVADTGAGIDPDVLKKVTQPHVRSDRSDSFGLGLFIVQRLCDRLGWGFEIESEVGRGTTAELIFRTAPA
ncbi:MAG: HAMP domain-containing sensor histidine kinase [Desulfobacterales bacterium]|jgi:signal transduction histidine kinase